MTRDIFIGQLCSMATKLPVAHPQLPHFAMAWSVISELSRAEELQMLNSKTIHPKGQKPGKQWKVLWSSYHCSNQINVSTINNGKEWRSWWWCFAADVLGFQHNGLDVQKFSFGSSMRIHCTQKSCFQPCKYANSKTICLFSTFFHSWRYKK